MCVVLSNSERNLIIIKGERLVKVDDLDCDAIRMLQQIFSVNSECIKYISTRKKMQFAIDGIFGREIRK